MRRRSAALRRALLVAARRWWPAGVHGRSALLTVLRPGAKLPRVRVAARCLGRHRPFSHSRFSWIFRDLPLLAWRGRGVVPLWRRYAWSRANVAVIAPSLSPVAMHVRASATGTGRAFFLGVFRTGRRSIFERRWLGHDGRRGEGTRQGSGGAYPGQAGCPCAPRAKRMSVTA